MKSTRAILIFIVVFAAAGIFAAAVLPKEHTKNKNALLKIGAGDDISGVLMEETVKGLSKSYKVSEAMESSSFQDCCSNSAQWALNAKEINIGFYCSHIAKHTVAQNSDVMIYGPAVMNAEVICYKDNWDQVTKLGVTQGRQQLQEISRQSYPQIQGFDEITQKGILYTLEDGQIDGAILDATKAVVTGEYKYMPLSQQDYISYVLVVDKQFAATKAFTDFIKSYNEAVSRLNDRSYLADTLGTEKGSAAIQQIKFLSLDEDKE